MMPGRAALAAALAAAGAAHHEYEEVALAGVRDEGWPAFYAAYVLGRVGDFIAPSRLAALLEAVDAPDDWPTAAAAHVLEAASD